MEVWILYGDEIDSAADLAFEVRRFLAEGQKMGVDVRVFKPSQFDLLVSQSDRSSVLIEGNPVPLPDFFFPYLGHHDRSYFSHAIIRQIERLRVPVFNNAATVEMVADKLHTHQVLAEHDMPTPDTMLAKFPVDIRLIESTIGFPVVVKTLLGGGGSGVFLIEDASSFQKQMNLIGETSPNIQMIFQRFVAASRGRDLRLFVVDGRVVASMERTAPEGDFKANYSMGGSVREFIPDDAARDLAVRTADILNIQVAGVDLLFTEDGGYTICEANTFPGFKGLESCCDVNVPYEIFTAMQKRLERRERNIA